VGTWNSLALSPDGSPCISYYSETDQVLKIACASAMDPHVGLRALHRAGQTFLTWPERGEQQGERYAVYRSRAPITSANLPQAQRLARVGENSSRIWGNYSGFNGIWSPRLTDRMIIEDNARPLHTGTGALVWTLAAEDFGGAAAGDGYYAVSVLPADGGPELLLDGYALGPVKEALGDPLPVEISGSPGIHPGPGGHYYLQYMDLRRWNPTYHAPNSANQYYGFDVNEPGLSDALAYTYDYAVFEPTTGLCGGALPDPLPVMFFLHGARGNRYGNPDVYPYPYCAYGVYPIDQSETWYFGFAREHDYRSDAAFAPGDVIENFTERRVLRMLYDLERNPPGPAVDEQRIYLFGHSMGGTGALAFAQRYPNVFAAIYAGQPVTTFRVTAGVNESWPETAALRWGAQELNLPVAIQAPNGWADALQQYNGVGVFDWENLQSAFDPQALPDRSGGDFVPFGIDHGTIDDSVDYPSQGRPLYPLLAAAPRAWAGAVTTAEHQWSFFGWPLANLGKVNDVPFYGLRVVRDETVPGLSRLSGSPSGPVDSPTQYNQTLLWSASWNAWDGAPLDRPDEWQMSLCAAPAGSLECGGKTSLTVDITPRRVQAFHTVPGQTYRWENTSISSGQALATGTLLADQHGLVTIPAVQVSPEGNRLRLWKP
jgi:pimeloyl-ACP methyl ester carboxylesterase